MAAIIGKANPIFIGRFEKTPVNRAKIEGKKSSAFQIEKI